MNAFQKYLQPRGTMSELARALDVTPAAVRQWSETRIPAERIIEIEAATGIPREALRPDLYQRAPVAALLRPKKATAQ